jgi:hypothetical protein
VAKSGGLMEGMSGGMLSPGRSSCLNTSALYFSFVVLHTK